MKRRDVNATFNLITSSHKEILANNRIAEALGLKLPLMDKMLICFIFYFVPKNKAKPLFKGLPSCRLQLIL